MSPNRSARPIQGFSCFPPIAAAVALIFLSSCFNADLAYSPLAAGISFPITASLSSATYSASTLTTVLVSDCKSATAVLINEVSSTPLATDPNWVTCVVGTQNYVVAGEGLHSLYVWSKDSTGTVNSLPVPLAMTLDTVTPTTSLTSLTGGQILAGASAVALTWSASDLDFGSAPIALSYSTDGGVTWTPIATVPNSGSYSWTVPSLNLSTARVQVTATDLAGNSTSAFSTTNFSIDSTAPSVSLTSLTGGGIYAGGSLQSVTWTATDSNLAPTPISIDYSQDGGATWSSVATALSNSGAYSWTLPSIDNSAVRVRVSAIDLAGNLTSAASTSNFAIDTSPPIVSLTAPSGGVYLAGGSSTSITWTASSANFGPTPIQLDYTTNGGTTWNSIASSVGNTGIYSWTVPSINSATVQVRVTATDTLSNSTPVSTPNFTIDSISPTISITAPTASQYFRGGNTTSITWTGGDTNLGATPIQLDYSYDGGTSWNSIAGPIANTGSYSWTVPSIDSGAAKVRATITDLAGQATSASVGPFTVDSTAPSVTLTSFNLGGVYSGGSTHTIGWTASDASLGAVPIQIDLSSDGGATWSSIATNQANTGTYSWALPVINNSNMKIRVTAADLVGLSTSVVSSIPFTIDSTPPTVSLTSFNSGGSTCGGVAQPVTWSATDANLGSTPISIDYSTDSGTTWTPVATNLTNSSTYNWTPPAIDGTHYRVRVNSIDLAGNSASSSSSVDFTITGSPTTATFNIPTPTGQTANNVDYYGVNVTIKNACGNPVPFLPVTFTVTAGGNLDPGTATDINGIAYTGVRAITPGTKTVTLTSPTITGPPTVSVSFATAATPVYTSVALSGPTTATAGDCLSFTMTTLDQFLTPIVSGDVFTLATTAGTGHFFPDLTSCLAYSNPPDYWSNPFTFNISGTSSWTFYFRPEMTPYPSPVTFTLTPGFVPLQTASISTVIGAPNLYISVLKGLSSRMTASPASGLTADGVASSTITVVAKDRWGNVEKSHTINLAATPGGILGSNSLVTDSSGTATTTLKSTSAGPIRVWTTNLGFSPLAFGTTVLFTPPLARVQITSAPRTTTSWNTNGQPFAVQMSVSPPLTGGEKLVCRFLKPGVGGTFASCDGGPGTGTLFTPANPGAGNNEGTFYFEAGVGTGGPPTNVVTRPFYMNLGLEGSTGCSFTHTPTEYFSAAATVLGVPSGNFSAADFIGGPVTQFSLALNYLNGPTYNRNEDEEIRTLRKDLTLNPAKNMLMIQRAFPTPASACLIRYNYRIYFAKPYNHVTCEAIILDPSGEAVCLNDSAGTVIVTQAFKKARFSPYQYHRGGNRLPFSPKAVSGDEGNPHTDAATTPLPD